MLRRYCHWLTCAHSSHGTTRARLFSCGVTSLISSSIPRRFSRSTTSGAEEREEGRNSLSDDADLKEQYQATEAPPLSSPNPPPKTSILDRTASHHSLESFHAHALRTGLSTTSTVYTGTAYEYLAQSTLQPYGFELQRVGGRGDRGVDLLGVWQIPKLSAATGEWKETTRNQKDGGSVEVETEALKVLVQCKRLVGRHAKIGPNLIRELDGAVRGARHSEALFDVAFPHVRQTPTEERSQEGDETHTPGPWTGPALGVLVGTRPATKGVIESMRRSSRGLVWIMMEETSSTTDDAESQSPSPSPSPPPSPPPADSQIQTEHPPPDPSSPPSTTRITQLLRGRVKQMLWNQAARDLGLEGVDVVNRYDSQGREELVLMRGGRVWGGVL